MRILVANDGIAVAGGVQAYLDAVIPALEARGHLLATVHGRDDAASAAAALEPDVCFSHNMHDLDVDRTLMRAAPVVKFVHGYFGTCVSSLKMHGFPRRAACDRELGPACLALYVPRRCGQMGASVMWRQWQWATTQKRLLDSYAALVVASHHMRRELVRHTHDADRVHVNALFPTCRLESAPAQIPATPHVVFLGRMTALKGGDVLIRAVRHAEDRMRQRIRLTLLGDGPQRSEWQDLARTLQLTAATFPGWLGGSQRDSILRSASVAAMPSLWPEPFGLAGLDAGAFGVPTVAFNVGGVSEWLRDGVNGVCVDPSTSAAAFGDALAAVLSDPARLAALREGAQKVARELTVGAHVDRLEAVFARACEGACASS